MSTSSAPNSDIELLEAWRAGDQRSGELLYVRYLGTLARFFRNKVPRGIDEDLTQQTFLGLVEGRDRIHSNVKSYVLGIARNVLRTYIRSKRPDASLDESQMCELAPGPTSIFTRHRRTRILLEALRQLRTTQQIMLELYYWEGYSTTELAEYLETNPSTLRTRLSDARRQLGRLMAESLGSECTDADIDEWARALRDLVGPDLDQVLSS